jgi:hypothetical protein
MQIVNGYPCASCTDVSFVKRGVDPKDPTGEKAKALKAETDGPQATDPATGAPIDPTWTRSGIGTSGDATNAGDTSGAPPRPRPPAAPGQPGSVLDVTV